MRQFSALTKLFTAVAGIRYCIINRISWIYRNPSFSSDSDLQLEFFSKLPAGKAIGLASPLVAKAPVQTVTDDALPGLV